MLVQHAYRTPIDNICSHGLDLFLLERREFLRILYDHLPEKSKILFGCKVKAIVETQSGVEVSLHNGRTERGDVLIGCDGVHSTVRESMWISAAMISPGLITVDEKKCKGSLSPSAKHPLMLSSFENNLDVLDRNGRRNSSLGERAVVCT